MSWLWWIPLVYASGVADLPEQALRETTIYVDILNPGEMIEWTGEGQITAYDPVDQPIGQFSSGSSIPTAFGVGRYRLETEPVDVDLGDLLWDVTVPGALGGRVWSRNWRFNARGFGVTQALTGSFYVLVEGGQSAADGVIEVRLDGYAGFKYSVSANGYGIDDTDGRSVFEGDGIVYLDYPVYLQPPEIAQYNPIPPSISGLQFTDTCGGVAVDELDGVFEFTTATSGQVHLVCDINGDSLFDPSSNVDVHMMEDVFTGVNQLTWDGRNNLGLAVPPGDYECELWVTTGELHFISSDIESSYLGMRMFSVDSAGQRLGMPMWFNDAEVQSSAVSMPNFETPLESSGPDGLDSGASTAAAVANVNARSWGAFSSQSKGNQAYLDTYTWLEREISSAVTVTVLDVTVDTDGDGLSDLAETCEYNTDPTVADTDGDGLNDGPEAAIGTDPLVQDSDGDGLLDGEEVPDPSQPTDTDNDGLVNPLDDDDDGDGRATRLEDVNQDSDWLNDDTDGDTIPNYLDPDDDGDGVPSLLEGFTDQDGDGLDNALDTDDDDDGVPTAQEDTNANGDWFDDDSDGDGLADFLDNDEDNDGIPNPDEDLNGNQDLNDEDSDVDQVPDWLDPDDDGDGIDTLIEGDSSIDTDGDSIPDYLDTDSDNDGVPDADEGVVDTDRDSVPDYLDTDDDGDGIDTSLELGADTDADGTPDYLDPDDDNDGLPTSDETTDDADQDGLPNHHDPDSDNDGLLDGQEGVADADGDGQDNYVDTDSDGDGVPDGEEGVVDSDGDGLEDFVDDDDDNDGVPTESEVSGDTDGDGLEDRIDDDDDGDGIPTLVESGWISPDVDLDGQENWLDLDSDDDGIEDSVEGVEDSDGDGTPNYLDPDGAYRSVVRGGGLISCSTATTPSVGGLLMMLCLLGWRRR